VAPSKSEGVLGQGEVFLRNADSSCLGQLHIRASGSAGASLGFWGSGFRVEGYGLRKSISSLITRTWAELTSSLGFAEEGSGVRFE
jgi:hypothetical protein